MSEPNNKAKQAAATRALNQLQQEEANKRLIESTHGKSRVGYYQTTYQMKLGPHDAKSKALQSAGRETC